MPDGWVEHAQFRPEDHRSFRPRFSAVFCVLWEFWHFFAVFCIAHLPGGPVEELQVQAPKPSPNPGPVENAVVGIEHCHQQCDYNLHFFCVKWMIPSNVNQNRCVKCTKSQKRAFNIKKGGLLRFLLFLINQLQVVNQFFFVLLRTVPTLFRFINQWFSINYCLF